MQFFNTAIPDGSITTAKIVDLAVTTAKIAALAVTNDKLAGPRFKSTFITVTGAFTPDANATLTLVILQAPGGGGAGCPATGASQYSVGQPGAAGETCIGVFTPTQIGASVNVTIGTPGPGGVGAAPVNATESTFGALLSAYPGTSGGSNGPASYYLFAATNGQSFNSGIIATGTSGLPVCGVDGVGRVILANGGSCMFGHGGFSGFQVNAVDGAGYGYGGGGTIQIASSGALNGGAGGNSFCWVLEFY